MTDLEKTVKKIKANMGEQLDAHVGEIKAALSKLPTGKYLSLSIGVKVNDLGDGEHAIKTTLSFVMQKVKAELSASVNERQEELPGTESDDVTITPAPADAAAETAGPAKEKKQTRRKDQHAGKGQGIRP